MYIQSLTLITLKTLKTKPNRNLNLFTIPFIIIQLHRMRRLHLPTKTMTTHRQHLTNQKETLIPAVTACKVSQAILARVITCLAQVMDRQVPVPITQRPPTVRQLLTVHHHPMARPHPTTHQQLSFIKCQPCQKRKSHRTVNGSSQNS